MEFGSIDGSRDGAHNCVGFVDASKIFATLDVLSFGTESWSLPYPGTQFSNFHFIDKNHIVVLYDTLSSNDYSNDDPR